MFDGNPSTNVSAGVVTIRGHPLRRILVTLRLVDSASHRDELRARKVIGKRLSAGSGPIKYPSSKLRARLGVDLQPQTMKRHQRPMLLSEAQGGRFADQKQMSKSFRHI